MKCSGIDCPNYAEKLKCPTCVKLGLPEAYFCSQECFKENWAVHKIFHQAKIEQSNTPERFRGFAFTGPLRPGLVSPMRTVPPHIPRPDYADNGIPIGEKKENPAIIPVYTPNEIEKMKTVCRMSREVLEIAASLVKPGVTGEEIDEVVHNACIERGAYPSPLNYYNYPKSCCISVNEVICHGIPDSRKLEEGDIVNIDISLFYDGVHGDVNDTYFVGEVDDESKHLVKTTRECLDKAIEIVKPGTMYRQLGEVITRHATRNNLSVVRTYCGHGVGMLFHCSPSVPHYSKNKAVGVMKPGHIFTIEPMINVGTWKDKLWPDDWTATTLDGKRSAQFEETILVTEDGYEVLTAGNRNYNFQCHHHQ